jgi:hypothetical protein
VTEEAMGRSVNPLSRALTAAVDDYKAELYNPFILAEPRLFRVRRRSRSQHTNGVAERFFGSIHCEHLYRFEIPDGLTRNGEAEAYRRP